MGLVDSLVKFAQHRYVSDTDTALFSAVLFLNAFIAGLGDSCFYSQVFSKFLSSRQSGAGVFFWVP